MNEPKRLPFVANKHDDHVRVGVLARVFEPRGQVVEGVASCDVVDEERARSASVV